MKRLVLLLVSLFILSVNIARSADFLPPYTDSIAFWGAGVVKVGKTVNIHAQNCDEAPVVEVIRWDERGNIGRKSGMVGSINQTFAAFLPEAGLVFLTMEEDDDKWVRVCYDQKYQKFGWIKKEEGHEAFFWQEFFDAYAKKNGLYVFRNITKEQRKLYAQPEDGAQSVDGFELAKHITPWLVRGNWMLVKVLNYDNTRKTGWIKWRDSDGRLFAFVDFRHK